VDRVPLEVRIELLLFHLVGLEFLVAGGHVARSGFPLFPGFRAFEYDKIAWHGLKTLNKPDVFGAGNFQIENSD
jgi:hypothetical protein